MNDPILVITDIVMVQKQSQSLIVTFQKQSHDITQTAPQIAWTLPSTAITGTILFVVEKRIAQLPANFKM